MTSGSAGTARRWKTTFVLQEIYQQPDDETLLRVVTRGAELRSAG